MAALGMLSLSAPHFVDTYGPIADNAGGISEMSKLIPKYARLPINRFGREHHGRDLKVSRLVLGLGGHVTAGFLCLPQPVAQSTNAIATGIELIINMINPLL